MDTRIWITRWQPAGPGDDPGARLTTHATLVTRGGDVTLHLDAIAVHVTGTVQSATHPDLDDILAGWHHAAGADGHLATVGIDGRDYAVFACPAGR